MELCVSVVQICLLFFGSGGKFLALSLTLYQLIQVILRTSSQVLMITLRLKSSYNKDPITQVKHYIQGLTNTCMINSGCYWCENPGFGCEFLHSWLRQQIT